MRQDEQALETLVEAMVRSHVDIRQDEHTIAIAALQEAGPDLYGRLVRRIIAGLKGDTRALTEKHIAAVIRLIEKSGPFAHGAAAGPVVRPQAVRLACFCPAQTCAGVIQLYER